MTPLLSRTELYLRGKRVVTLHCSHTLEYGIWGKDSEGIPGRLPQAFDEKRELNTGRVVSVIPKYWRWGWWQDATPEELEAEGIETDRHIAKCFLKLWIWKITQREVKDGFFHLWIQPKYGLRYIGYKPYMIDEDDVWAVDAGIELGPALMRTLRTGKGELT